MNEIIKTFCPPLITLIIGGFIGNRWALCRDKRKEFNTVADPIRIKLLQTIDFIKSGHINYDTVTSDEIVSLEILLSKRRGKKFKKAAQYRHDAYWESGRLNHGTFTMVKPEIYIKSLENLLKFTKRR